MRLSPLRLHECMYVCVRFIACMQLAREGALLSSIYLSSGAFVCIYFYVNTCVSVCVWQCTIRRNNKTQLLQIVKLNISHKQQQRQHHNGTGQQLLLRPTTTRAALGQIGIANVLDMITDISDMPAACIRVWRGGRVCVCVRVYWLPLLFATLTHTHTHALTLASLCICPTKKGWIITLFYSYFLMNFLFILHAHVNC